MKSSSRTTVLPFDAETGAPNGDAVRLPSTRSLVPPPGPSNTLPRTPDAGPIAFAVFLIFAAAVSIGVAYIGMTHDDRPARVSVASSFMVDVQERRVDALATRITELEDRAQRTADAAAGSDPIPAPATHTPVPENRTRAAVSPPEYLPVPAPTEVIWNGIGGTAR